MTGSECSQRITVEHRKKCKRIANALNAMRTLRTEVVDWQSRQTPRASDAGMTSAHGPEHDNAP